MPADVIEFLARTINRNVRELVGGLNKLIAYAQLTGQEVSLQLAEEQLTDILSANRRRITIDEIQRTVCQFYRIDRAEMSSKRRARAVVRPRQVAMYLAKVLTPRSYPEIGRKFGGRDHSTVIHAVRLIEDLRTARCRYGRRCAQPAATAGKLTGEPRGPSVRSTGADHRSYRQVSNSSVDSMLHTVQRAIHGLSPDRLDRFARHIVLPEIGGAGQVALGKTHVRAGRAAAASAVPALQYLAGAGDRPADAGRCGDVETSNLQRQTIYTARAISAMPRR